MLRKEYMNIRKGLLRKTLEGKFDKYLKKHCDLAKKAPWKRKMFYENFQNLFNQK